ncbi:hypothetical protein B7760_01724 [Burkholderia glumae]|uniref:hypothetical protein n=1 Tax=Burkholderia glumae TaxID=337 RepID=UPI00157B34F0|nr:hypothetical protein [Burkholderia glumae]QKM47701.1 hypothetical protein B7760_01724 [Burkholderia glumae]
MKKGIFSLFVASLVMSVTVSAQTFKANNIDMSGAVSFNSVRGVAVGRALNGAGTLGDQGPVFLGNYSGGSYPLTNPGPVGIGSGALASITGADSENTAIGTWACRFLTTGMFNACLGMNALGSDPTAQNFTAVGNDAARNEYGGGHDTVVVGSNAGRNGTHAYNVAIGANALFGGGVSLTLGGKATPGDTITLTMTSNSPSVTNSPKTVSYTVNAGDTLFTIAQRLAGLATYALSGKETLMQAFTSYITGVTPTQPAVVMFDFPGTQTVGWSLQVTATLSPGATETVKIDGGAMPNSVVAVGYGAAHGPAMTNPSNDVFIGSNSGSQITWASRMTCVGDKSR